MFWKLLVPAAALALLPTAFAQDAVDYRLPPGITPTAQSIHLTLDPSTEHYSGTTTIRLDVQETSERIGVYQIGLDMRSISLQGPGGVRSLEADADDWDINWLSDGNAIAPGQYTLTIDYSGRYSTDALGMHRVTFEGRDYVFTQMEAMYARRAFPLFDEPSFKIPWQVTITAPENLTVIANTPVESTESADGMQRVRFMETRPLPSYLLAWAVGPLDRAPLEGMSVPGYIYTPQGHTDKLGFVLKETPNILASLEEYFGFDYPFRKLDMIAVPDFAFGAMENPGLITYRTDLLLLGDDVSGATALTSLMVIAHEIAHIWYGDVVTMAWWDDLWLNEAFASWMAWSTVEKLYPQYDPQLNLPQAAAFGADQQSTVRPIRRTVRNNEEIFDSVGLNYSKGHAILNMLENYVGPEVWQQAVRNYIDRYAWKNATERDLWAAVSEESGIDVGEIAGDYLNQPGYARVSIDNDGRVTQERYRRPGIEVPDLEWTIPLNVKYRAGDDVRQAFYLLDEKSGTIDLPSDAEWVFPDAGGNGYYRWQTDVDQLYALLDDVDALNNREKIALLDNVEALLDANALTLNDYLYVLNKLLYDPYPLVFLPTLEKVKDIGDNFVDGRTADAFARFVDESMSWRFAQIGASPKAGEGEAIGQMRPRLLRMLGEYGGDAAARDAARDIAERFVADPGSVNIDLAREGLRVTALNDDGSMYDAYIAAYRKATNAAQRTVVLQSIYFDNPEIVEKHLDFTLTDDVASGDTLTGISLYSTVLDDNTPIYEWLDENLAAVMAKIPSYYHPLLPQALGGGCSPEALQRLNAFFADRGEQFAGALTRASEASRNCIDGKKRNLPDLQAFLARYNGD